MEEPAFRVQVLVLPLPEELQLVLLVQVEAPAAADTAHLCYQPGRDPGSHVLLHMKVNTGGFVFSTFFNRVGDKIVKLLVDVLHG